MTDLVQRLRSMADGNQLPSLIQAANRIEQLERELADANKPPTGTAPCARFCEHTAFVIEARQSKALIERIERENAELRKDATRYRWLRDQNADLYAGFYVCDETNALPDEDITWVGTDLDSEIDAAMQKEQE